MTAFEIINQIEADKVANHRKPKEALKIEVIKIAQAMGMAFAKEIMEAEITELERQGKVILGETLNDNYIIVLR